MCPTFRPWRWSLYCAGRQRGWTNSASVWNGDTDPTQHTVALPHPRVTHGKAGVGPAVEQRVANFPSGLRRRPAHLRLRAVPVDVERVRRLVAEELRDKARMGHGALVPVDDALLRQVQRAARARL
eukprot:5672531-Prymnesium_polylepis.1